jgi:hypothetical protein
MLYQKDSQKTFKEVFSKAQEIYSTTKDNTKNKSDIKYCIHIFLAVSNYVGDITKDEFHSLIRYYGYIFDKGA